jgi:hypothetical protein
MIKSLTLQSTGQGCVLHTSVSDSAGQGAPVPLWGTTTVRVLVLEPPPHVAVHGLKSEKSLTLQSTTGQGCVLHTSVSDSAGHSFPFPLFGVITVLNLV